jgi:hypothetical protein
MSKSSKIFWVAIIVVVVLGLGYWYLSNTSSVTNSQPSNPTTTTTQSSDKLINSFSFSQLNPEADGAIDNVNYAVNLLVPSSTDLTKLIPTISVSDGATISPSSGTPEDFTNPVTYTVTAQDGSTQNYTVTVTTSASTQSNTSAATQSSSKSINSFVFSGLSPEVDGTVDNTNYAVNLTVPSSTDVTNLTPTITVSDGATISPNSGVAQDFTNPVTYTVTAQDGSIQDYTVTVTNQSAQ